MLNFDFCLLMSAIILLLASSVLARPELRGLDPETVLASYPSISSCLSQPSVFSCENTTLIKNTCCSPTPGGLVLQTQYWSTWTGLESQGQKLPKASWTIHGLWPDNCDGSFDQYCDLSRQYDPSPDPAVLPDGTVVPPYKGPGVDTFIKAFGREDLLEYSEFTLSLSILD